VFVTLFLTNKLNSAIRRAAFLNQIMNHKAAQTKTIMKTVTTKLNTFSEFTTNMNS